MIRIVRRPQASSARGGFTLVEMLLYIGIASVILVLSLQTLIRVMESRQRSAASSDVQQGLRVAVNRMLDTALNAASVDAGTSVFGTANGRLAFTMGDAADSPTVFALSGNAVTLAAGAKAALPLTPPTVKVDTLRFTNLTPSNGVAAVRIEIHATQSGALVSGAPQAMTIDTSFSLRR